MKRNRRGFTLIEFCIVLGLSAVIIAMCCGFILNNYKYSVDNQKNVDAMAEITQVQSLVKSWIAAYDSNAYTVKAIDNSPVLQSEPTVVSGLTDSSRLANVDNKLVWYISDNGTEEVVQALELKNISEITFKLLENKISEDADPTQAVSCSITLADGRYVDVDFTLFSLTERNRFLSSQRE